MKKHILMLFLLFFLFHYVNGQKRILLKYGDQKMMTKHGGDFIFKNNLPDGHYICSFTNDTNRIAKELIVSKKKSKQVYIEYDYSNFKALTHMFTLKNGELDGPFVINWFDGKKKISGYFKNGYPDSIWTYYSNHKMNSSIDTINHWKEKEIRKKDGISYLITAWDANGKQMITNGNGTFVKNNGTIMTSTTYKNGLKNGIEKEIVVDSSITFNNRYYPSENYYVDGLLTKETLYYYSNNIESISEWTYLNSPKLDTIRSIIDGDILDFNCYQINFKYYPIRNGHWVAFYKNGNKVYDGNYSNEQRVGIWNWYFEDGEKKVTADYKNNSWLHYNNSGKVISNQNCEYLTYLCEGMWDFSDDSNDTISILIKGPMGILGGTSYSFSPEGIQWCHNNSISVKCTYKLLVDILELNCVDEDSERKFYSKNKIISASNEKIVMKILTKDF